MKILNTLLIGLGDIGMGYDLQTPKDLILTHAKAVSLDKDFKLVAGVDPNKNKRDIFEKKYKTITFPSISEVNLSEKIDFCIISCSTEYHFASLKEVISVFHPSVILCEKPFTGAEDTAQQIIDLCSKLNIDLFVNYFRRFDASTLQIKDIIDESKDNNIFASVFYPKGLLHNGSHFFNLLEFWLGDYIRGSSLSVDRDTEDKMLVQFERGEALFYKITDTSSPCSIDIHGNFGKIRYENNGESIKYYKRIESKTFEKEYIISDDPIKINCQFTRYQGAVLDEIKKGNIDSAQSCKGSDALKTIKSINNLLSNQ